MSPEKVLAAGGYASPVGSDVGGGLTVRDFFAAHALAGILASAAAADGAPTLAGDRDATRWAYEYADGMLARREVVRDTD